MRQIPKLLSKTKLMRGYRCMKCIYLTIHHPELEAPITPETQALFDQGNEVGAKAREYFPGGALIDNKPWDFYGAIAKTQQLISSGTQIIYEAAFEYMGCYARADIIVYSPISQRWSVYEVKSSTKVKPEQYDDVGLQAWIMAKSGLPLETINIMHLNTACRFPDLSNLFQIVDVTEEIRERYTTIKPTVRDILTKIRETTIPAIDIGPQCTVPTECGFVAHCWNEKKIPTMSIFNLPKIYSRQWDLYHEGIVELDDPRLTDLTELQERIVDCFKHNRRFIDRDQIRAALSTWQFPLVFLDFETINPAIPRYEGTKPFEQVPFQFSVHLWPAPNDSITHHAFLHTTSDDPRPKLIPELLAACGERGSIVAYFSRFESDRIKALAEYAPEYQDKLLCLLDRMVDPLDTIRAAVYDNAFNGSFSLKKVAPALLGQEHSYAGMEVADGGAAQRAFEELISPKTSLNRKLNLESAMLAYCEKDTLVMVELVKWLYQQIA